MKTLPTATTWSGLTCFTAIDAGIRSLVCLVLVLTWTSSPGAGLIARITNASAEPVADAVVVAVPEDGTIPESVPGRDSVDQVDRQFVPHVKAIYAGTSVFFPNKDNIRHHVYSFSRAKRFELPLYSGVPADPVNFDTPGVVTLGCNIHDWMIGYIYVSESPWFAVSGADGVAEITELPAGRYRLRSWHPLMESDEEKTERIVELEQTSTAEISWGLTLKPDIRPRRAPVGGIRGYR